VIAAAIVSAGMGCAGSERDGDGGLGSELVGPAVMINEVLANEAGSDVAGEFVELVNAGDAPANLVGWQLSDGSGLRHVFSADSTLAPGQALVVFGGESAIPGGLDRAVAASSGSLGLSNGGDTITLADASSAAVDSSSYSGSLSSTDGVSMNRSVDADPDASFALHTQLASAPSSPGTRVDGSPFGDGGGGDDGSDDGADDGTDGTDDGTDGTDDGTDDDGDGAGEVRVRIVAANLTSGNDQSYDPGHGIRILQGLAPDVALVSEMNFGGNSSEDIRAFVDQAFGPEFQFTRQDDVSIPCGVVTRYPIVESGIIDDPTLTDRDLSFARIDVPGGRDLWAISVHLSGASSTNRTSGANAIVSFVSSRVPASDLIVVGGDMNTRSRGESCVQSLSEVVTTSGPYPVDQAGEEDTNQPRNEPYDWVLADPDLDALEVPTEIGTQSFPAGLVFDSRAYSPLSDVSPAQMGDSAAQNMQHMAVIRDFLLPGD
jgi:endonuclease/exonuclease/phosphatase family metal-dependent hydrolase